MWKERFRNIFGEPAGQGSSSPSGIPGGAKLRSQTSSIPPTIRHSNGVEQFFNSLRSDDPLSILDLAVASQANISFVTGMGHRISSEDMLGTMDQCFGDGDFLENQNVPSKAQRFLDQILRFPESQFDGCLVWDTFQFLVPPLLDQVIEHLLKVMRPGGVLLAFFSSDEKMTRMPVYSYRIQDAKTLLLAPRNTERPVQYFNNRAVERLFGSTQSVKFFLSRDHLREVIVRR